MGPLTEFTTVLCRLWIAIYTCGLPAELYAARRAEIDSDLWEFRTDAGDSGHVAAGILVRLLLGVPNDLLWRLELTDRRARTRQSIAALAGAVAAMVLTVVWMGLSLMNPELPKPAPAMSFIAAPRPPPPPPPPPPDDYLKLDLQMKPGAQVARDRSHGINR